VIVLTSRKANRIATGSKNNKKKENNYLFSFFLH
jgi:hypothetical protein